MLQSISHQPHTPTPVQSNASLLAECERLRAENDRLRSINEHVEANNVRLHVFVVRMSTAAQSALERVRAHSDDLSSRLNRTTDTNQIHRIKDMMRQADNCASQVRVSIKQASGALQDAA